MLTTLINKLIEFRDARGWAKYHTPKELAAAIAIEAAELQREFLWRKDFDYDEYRIKSEMADVFIFLLQMANVLNCNLIDEAFRKIAFNELKYPVKESVDKWG